MLWVVCVYLLVSVLHHVDKIRKTRNSVVCLLTKHPRESNAGVTTVLIQTSLLLDKYSVLGNRARLQ